MWKTRGGWGETFFSPPPPRFPSPTLVLFFWNTSALYYLRSWHRLIAADKYFLLHPWLLLKGVPTFVTYLLEALYVIAAYNLTRKTISRRFKMHSSTLPYCCPFLKQGLSSYTFSSIKEKRRMHDPLNCKSRNLICLFEGKKRQQTVLWGDQAQSPRTLWGALQLHSQLWP